MEWQQEEFRTGVHVTLAWQLLDRQQQQPPEQLKQRQALQTQKQHAQQQ